MEEKGNITRVIFSYFSHSLGEICCLTESLTGDDFRALDDILLYRVEFDESSSYHSFSPVLFVFGFRFPFFHLIHIYSSCVCVHLNAEYILNSRKKE